MINGSVPSPQCTFKLFYCGLCGVALEGCLEATKAERRKGKVKGKDMGLPGWVETEQQHFTF